MTLARVKNWVNETLYAPDLNAEFNNILNYLNASKIVAVDALSLSANDFLQYSGSVWANKTPAQVIASLTDEQTFTPTDTSGAGLAFTDVGGKYTQVRGCVFVNFSLTFPVTASSAQVSLGLPVPVLSGDDGICSVVYPIANNNVVIGTTAPGTSNLVFFDPGVGILQNATLSGKTIQITFHYQAEP